MMGKQGLKASCSLSSLWSPGLRGDLSLETTKHSHTLQMASTYGKHNLTLTAALNTLDKVGGRLHYMSVGEYVSVCSWSNVWNVP